MTFADLRGDGKDDVGDTHTSTCFLPLHVLVGRRTIAKAMLRWPAKCGALSSTSTTPNAKRGLNFRSDVNEEQCGLDALEIDGHSNTESTIERL